MHPKSQFFDGHVLDPCQSLVLNSESVGLSNRTCAVPWHVVYSLIWGQGKEELRGSERESSGRNQFDILTKDIYIVHESLYTIGIKSIGNTT